MATLVAIIFPIFMVIGLGYVAVRLGLMTDVAVDGLLRFASTFAIPALLGVGIATLDLGRNLDLAMMAVFYGGAVTGFVVGMFGARLLFRRDWQDCVAIGFLGLFSNLVMLGLPVTERAFGPDEIGRTIVILSVHAPFCYILGITVMEAIRSAGRGVPATILRTARSMLRNPMVIGIAIGFAVNLTGVPIPALARDALDLLIRAALPVALFALGGVLCRYRPEGDLRLIAFVCAVSLLVHPATVWFAGKAAGLGEASFRAALTASAMPPGLNAFLFADLYGKARRVAASTVLLATVLSFVTAVLWLSMLP